MRVVCLLEQFLNYHEHDLHALFPRANEKPGQRRGFEFAGAHPIAFDPPEITLSGIAVEPYAHTHSNPVPKWQHPEFR